MNTCSMPECDRPVHARGRCGRHYERWRKHGDPTICLRRGVQPPGAKSHNWKGGRSRDTQGYVQAWVDLDDPVVAPMRRASDPYAPEHRLVMARYLGRPLTANETVHHVNGVKDDNRIENLQLRIGNHGRGTAYRCIDCGSDRIEPTVLLDENPENL